LLQLFRLKSSSPCRAIPPISVYDSGGGSDE